MANISLEEIQISYIERGIVFWFFLQNRRNTQSRHILYNMCMMYVSCICVCVGVGVGWGGRWVGG